MNMHGCYIPAGILVLACILDSIAGDPRWLPHPTVGMGRAALALEKPLRALGRISGQPAAQLASGIALATLVAGGVYTLSLWVLAVLAGYSKMAWAAASVILIYSAIGSRSMGQHAMAVKIPLAAHDIAASRLAAGMIVGRDTGSLDTAGIARAAVESVAENTCDGIVAPLVYATLGGAPLALAYRAVNTLDAMYGHRDDQNLYFGRAAARLDDLLNFLPARLTAVLFLAAGAVFGMDAARGLKILMADGKNSQSPNSGRPEAAVAGLLDIRLGGPVSYRGMMFDLPFFNAAGRLPEADDISSAVRLMQAASLIGLLLCAAASCLVTVYINGVIW